jgi:hypothetical protein
MINKMTPTNNPRPEPRAGAPEKWLSLVGFVVVTVFAVVAILFAK